MPQMIWNGHITFGLVSIPVALYPAENRDELDFTLLDKTDMSPIGYRKVNKATGEEVPKERIMRGFEYDKGRYVIVSDDDLRRASPERTQQIAIVAFVDPAEVDPRFYDRPYYLGRSGRARAGAPSSSRNMTRGGSTSTSVSSWTAFSRAGPCQRGRASSRAKRGWRCTSRIIPSGTAASRGSSRRANTARER
jgi:hypothetical protein